MRVKFHYSEAYNKKLAELKNIRGEFVNLILAKLDKHKVIPPKKRAMYILHNKSLKQIDKEIEKLHANSICEWVEIIED